jgi:hypothetical protein
MLLVFPAIAAAPRVFSVPAIVFLPSVAGGAVAGVPALAGILAIASVPAYPGLLILAGFLHTVLYRRHIRLSDYQSTAIRLILLFVIGLSVLRIRENIGLSDTVFKKSYQLPSSAAV